MIKKLLNDKTLKFLQTVLCFVLGILVGWYTYGGDMPLWFAILLWTLIGLTCLREWLRDKNPEKP